MKGVEFSCPIRMCFQECFIGCIDSEIGISICIYRVICQFDTAVFHDDFHSDFNLFAVLIKILHGA